MENVFGLLDNTGWRLDHCIDSGTSSHPSSLCHWIVMRSERESERIRSALFCIHSSKHTCITKPRVVDYCDGFCRQELFGFPSKHVGCSTWAFVGTAPHGELGTCAAWLNWLVTNCLADAFLLECRKCDNGFNRFKNRMANFVHHVLSLLRLTLSMSDNLLSRPRVN